MVKITKFVLKFCTTKNLFKYFRERYSSDQLKEINNVVKLRGKIRTSKLSKEFLDNCHTQQVFPTFLAHRIKAAKVRWTSNMERAFLNDEICKTADKLKSLRALYSKVWSKVRKFLSFFDWIRFCRYLANIEVMKRKEIRTKHFNTINWLRRQRFGSCTTPSGKNIINLSDYKLSKAEKFVLSHGLEFCLPPSCIKREEILAEFEILLAQLLHHTPKNKDELTLLKARLNEIAHSFCGSSIDTSKFCNDPDFLSALKSLRSNKNILITKPDKGSGVVILNRSDYINKMNSILLDSSKFKCLGSTDDCDNTAKNEARLQRCLLKMVKNNELPKFVYEAIRPTGSQRPRMYGLPKIHKKEIPCRPILSMIGSAQHELAKFLSAVLQPVLNLYSNNCIADSFSFAEMVRNLEVEADKSFLCSFDISSLFTNVPLAETIQICTETLYDGNLPTPVIPKHTFIELMEIATSSVEFSFNNIMYKQIDGVAMGSPLGPALANIFVGFYESKLFQNTSKPIVYCRYVDDTFCLFQEESELKNFLANLNSLHPSLKFTCEKEVDGSLPFLDVLISKSAHSFVTSVYRKATFTGQYIRWDSFGPKQRKTNLIDTLTHRALKICSKSTLKQELEKIRIILIDNGYPVSIVDSFITNKILKFQRKPKEGPKKCPVYVKLPWIGQPSFKTKRKLKLAIQNCFGAVQPRVIFRTKAILPTIHKDALPTFQKSLLVYQYVCRCGSRYVGRTSQRLQDRINQHVPKIIRNKLNQQRFQPNRQKKASISTPYCDSAIGNHLLENQNCAALYNQNQFSIISTARSDFHLAVLESIHITLSQPDLCRQKDFVYSLKLKL